MITQLVLPCDLIDAGDACNLFAFPSECNFSGLRFNLELVRKIKEQSASILEGSPFHRYIPFKYTSAAYFWTLFTINVQNLF